jgi:hypothetical protein
MSLTDHDPASIEAGIDPTVKDPWVPSDESLITFSLPCQTVIDRRALSLQILRCEQKWGNNRSRSFWAPRFVNQNGYSTSENLGEKNKSNGLRSIIFPIFWGEVGWASPVLNQPWPWNKLATCHSALLREVAEALQHTSAVLSCCQEVTNSL